MLQTRECPASLTGRSVPSVPSRCLRSGAAEDFGRCTEFTYNTVPTWMYFPPPKDPWSIVARSLSTICLALILGFALVQNSSADESSAATVDYLADVKPLLKAKCYACHGALKQEGGLRVDTAAAIRQGGDSGSAVDVSDVPASLLIERVLAEDESERMPQQGAELSEQQIALLEAWVQAGAAGPENEEPELDPREHWSFRAPRRAVLPEVQDHARSRNWVDSFVVDQHEKRGLQAQPEVDRSLLLRRVYLDLIGLPPTPQQQRQFAADTRPDAYDRAVDRLLNSPQYGERWGRHWMDVWRYSDWYGRRMVPDVWNSAPQIWRWRDWIIQSLNDDKGYDQMVVEMLAADEVAPRDAEANFATGYLIRNWYALNPNDWMRANVEHTAKAFLGLTFNCAHCHDHKYDPISQRNYFQMRAFFEPIGIRQDRVAGEADPGPFQEYNYSTLRKIVRLGAVRIFDKNPDAPTWHYSGGDERNRDKELGSIPPGVPAFLNVEMPSIESLSLPTEAWYPGMRRAIQETALRQPRAAAEACRQQFATAQQAADEALPPLQATLAQCKAEFQAAADKAVEKQKESAALSGTQSLVLDATTGRRILNNSLNGLKKLEDGATIRFLLHLVKDAHFNFQLSKDSVKGLTAGYVGFEQGRISSYRPGGFSEFAVGKYDVAAGESKFEVKLNLQTKMDRCLLAVRCLTTDRIVAEDVPVALNGWNPVGTATKPITFDARQGSLAIVDDICILPAASQSGTAPMVCFTFEPPRYVEGRDAVGIDGWTASPFCQAPAKSQVSLTVESPELRELSSKVRRAHAAVHVQQLNQQTAEAKLAAADAQLASVQARIAADEACYGVNVVGDVQTLKKAAARAELQAAVKAEKAVVLEKQQLQAAADALPPGDAKRAKQHSEATKQFAAANAALAKAQKALAEMADDADYTRLSPRYPKTSTGRRRALAHWITSRDNPLTARVAVNHIWMRHFHAPLVATVFDFGRNGKAPTHPQLLDRLALDLQDSDWSMKRLHRLLVTSAVYRTSSAQGSTSDASMKQDPENHYLWRGNPGRMEAEIVRDSLLFCADALDLKIGGQELENKEALTRPRRSMYFSCNPEADGKSEFGRLFDAADATQCYRRTRSIVPQQALALTNSQFVHKQSVDVAASVYSKLTPAEQARSAAFINSAYQRILARPPRPAELKVCESFLARQSHASEPDERLVNATRARESLIRALWNHNDFVTIR